MLRRVLISRELPIIVLTSMGVHATVQPIAADMIGWFLAGLVLVAFWALLVSMRAQDRTEAYLARLEGLLKENVRLSRKAISRMDTLLTMKPGTQVVMLDPVVGMLPIEQTRWEKFKAAMRRLLWD